MKKEEVCFEINGMKFASIEATQKEIQFLKELGIEVKTEEEQKKEEETNIITEEQRKKYYENEKRKEFLENNFMCVIERSCSLVGTDGKVNIEIDGENRVFASAEEAYKFVEELPYKKYLFDIINYSDRNFRKQILVTARNEYEAMNLQNRVYPYPYSASCDFEKTYPLDYTIEGVEEICRPKEVAK